MGMVGMAYRAGVRVNSLCAEQYCDSERADVGRFANRYSHTERHTVAAGLANIAADVHTDSEQYPCAHGDPSPITNACTGYDRSRLF